VFAIDLMAARSVLNFKLPLAKQVAKQLAALSIL